MMAITCAELCAMDFGDEEALRDTCVGLVRQLVPRCQSPIEKAFIKAWAHLVETTGKTAKICAILGAIEVQMPLDGYRLDFAFPSLRVAIELDGHASHKTKEQRTHDAERDRTLLSQRWLTIRFTGSEIVRDCAGVVAELERLLIDRALELGIWTPHFL